MTAITDITPVTIGGITYTGPPEEGSGSLAHYLLTEADQLLRREAEAMGDKRKFILAYEAIEAAMAALPKGSVENQMRAELVKVQSRILAEYKALV
jgi:hypothetical protein